METENNKSFHSEPSHRWVRVKFGGQVIADSKRTKLVWDYHHIPVYYFPLEDVSEEYLEPTGRSRDSRTSYNVKIRDQLASNAAWSYTAPEADRESIKDLIAFRWHKMDGWFEEEEEVFVHARDPYQRVDTILSSRHIQVLVDGVTVADTRRAVLLFETGLPTRYYIPTDDVQMDLLRKTDTQTSCPYKGIASYWSVAIGDKEHKDIVWGYLEPISEIPKIKGLLIEELFRCGTLCMITIPHKT